VDLDPDKGIKERINAMAATIHGRQLMVGMLLGLKPDDMPGPDKVQAEALAWIRFQEQFPAVKLSPKAEAIMGLAAASFASYAPLMAVVVVKAKMTRDAAKTKKATGPFNFPATNPADIKPAPNGHDPSGIQASPTGDEVVILSGVPDNGKLKFN
jgi:hypothetical protein